MSNLKKFYCLAADMGYGHQRAANPLAAHAKGGVINVNNYPGIGRKEKEMWQNQRGWYEWVSFFKKTPILGKPVFGAMDRMQEIPPLYPLRDLSASTWQQQFFFSKVKRGLGRQLIEKLSRHPLPLLTTFFVPVYFAEYYNYPGQVFCLTCDADLNRAWAPIQPNLSRVIYLATTYQVQQRLISYGVAPSRIILTGFPLPPANIGGEDRPLLKTDLAARLARLDPDNRWLKRHQPMVNWELGQAVHLQPRALTLTFAVGGAGAQRELAAEFLPSLKPLIKQKKIKINLVAGARPDVRDYFLDLLKQLRLSRFATVKVIFQPDKNSYFRDFNHALRSTDILLTKPSELSFYAGLGLPIIMTEPVGSQETYNHDWLTALGAAHDTLPLPYMAEWLDDWLHDGRLARAAWQGYSETDNLACYTIPKIINKYNL